MTASRRRLDAELALRRPELGDSVPRLIVAGLVRVDGRVVTNPRSLVASGSSIVVREGRPLRGTVKLAAALQAFGVNVEGRIALDVGAAAGGFTRALLDAGARRVHAVDAGHGQLTASLRADARVVNLERTNVSSLNAEVVDDLIELVTVDVSYLSLARAVSQLSRLRLSARADLVGLVKPMFELRRASAPTDDVSLDDAVRAAAAGIEASGWRLVASMESPVRGARDAREALVHAQRARAISTA